MSTKQLEEETQSLRCERAATIRQFNQLRDLHEGTRKTLELEREKLQQKEEALAESATTIQGLIDTIEAQKKNLEILAAEKEISANQETDLLSQISQASASLVQEKATCDALSISLKAANDSFHSLSLQLEQERHVLHDMDERCSLLNKEKETAEARVREVEELLITKIQSISDLEEELGDAIARGDDMEHRVHVSEQRAEGLTDDLQTTKQERDSLHEKGLQLEQHLGRMTTENAELKKRTEIFERLKKGITEASFHAHAILRACDTGPKPLSARAFPGEELSVNPPEHERSLFEERFEQHELF
jgi:DNA repair exonuclease SbcCD ATPase subunit